MGWRWLFALAAGFLLSACAGPEPLVDRDQTPLEEYWVMVESPAPEYPEAGEGARGEVRVQVLINRQGRVDEIQLLSAEPDERFVPAVFEALVDFRFEPGEANPERHPMFTDFQFEFEPDDAG